MSESKVAIDTQLETVDALREEIVTPLGNKKELTNSAAAAMAIARDEKHYGILAIRGKIINCLSNSEDKIFENEEIKLLLSAMNIIPGKYNSSKLRYGRIAICSDAD